jgi:hypothetical protein
VVDFPRSISKLLVKMDRITEVSASSGPAGGVPAAREQAAAIATKNPVDESEPFQQLSPSPSLFSPFN